MTLAFFGFLRLGELTCNSKVDPNIHLTQDSITFSTTIGTDTPEFMTVLIKESKSDPFRLEHAITIGSTASDICPVKAIRSYQGGVRTAAAKHDGQSVNFVICAHAVVAKGSQIGLSNWKSLRIETCRLVYISVYNMGIKKFRPFLKDITSKKYLRDFKGETATIDASCWLHKALSVSYAHCGDDSR